MNHEEAERFLARLGEGVPDQRPPLADIVQAGRAAKRRKSRRSVVIAAASVVLIAGGAALAQQVPRPDDGHPGHITTSPSGQAVDLVRTWPRWDPRDVDKLGHSAELAHRLPQSIPQPTESQPLADSPLTDPGVVTIQRDDTVDILSTTGEWRTVPVMPQMPRAVLSPAGTRLAVSTPDGIDVWELATGWVEHHRFPAGFKQWDFASAAWIDDTDLLLDDSEGGWLLDVVTGDASRVPYPRLPQHWWVVGEDGGLVESADHNEPAILTDWADGTGRRISMSGTGRLFGLLADHRTVVGASYESPLVDGLLVVVADREGLVPRSALPIHDHDANYSNWGLRPAVLRSDGTVLLWVAVVGTPQRDGWRLVSWDPATGDLSRITGFDGDPTWQVSYASSLLR